MATPLDIVVRRASPSDTPQLVELRWMSSIEDETAQEPRETFDAKMHSFLDRVLDDPRWTVWVGVEGSRIVTTLYAQVVTKVPRPWRNEGWVYVTAVYTRSDRRNEGVGTSALTSVCEWASERGLELLLLWPSERSRPFYERAGFHPAESLQLEL